MAVLVLESDRPVPVDVETRLLAEGITLEAIRKYHAV
jgi:hypothetical protein